MQTNMKEGAEKKGRRGVWKESGKGKKGGRNLQKRKKKNRF